MSQYIAIAVLFLMALPAWSQIGIHGFIGFGATPPATCTPGTAPTVWFDSDATAGQNWLGCTATDTWTVLGGTGTDDQTAAEVPFTPAGGIAANQVQAAIEEVDAEKQAADADLTTYAGITPSANVQSVLGAADYAAIRTLLALVVGTNVQAFDTDLSTYAGITPSANVQTLLSSANFAAFRSSLVVPQLIASGTASLGTSLIASEACATVVTVSATGVATTDTIQFTPNADISGVTGYAPVTTGGLSIYPYPTANNVNFKVCNPSAAGITPGAVTLNWRVTR